MAGTRTVHSIREDLGAVMTYIVSPTRTVLVKDMHKADPRWKLPGGSIERSDFGKIENDEFGVIAGAIREVEEETGIELSPSEIEWWYAETRMARGYLPHFCVARVSEEKLDKHTKSGDEDGVEIKVETFGRAEVARLDDERMVLTTHFGIICNAEEKLQQF